MRGDINDRLGYKPHVSSPVRSRIGSIAEGPVNADVLCKKLSTIHCLDSILCFFTLLIFYQSITLKNKEDKIKWARLLQLPEDNHKITEVTEQ